MRTLWIAGATCGAGVMYGTYALAGWLAATSLIVTLTIISGVLTIHTSRRVRHSMRELAQIQHELEDELKRRPTRML